MFRSSRRSILMAAVVSLCGMAPQYVSAQVLEEMIVTARKVEESLQDVPLSVTVMSGDRLSEAGITKIDELVLYVPNVTMSETGIGTNLYIRGIGSGINQGFEQSVGMYIDGVFHGRAQLMRAPFLDLAQAEVLRGPQVTLIILMPKTYPFQTCRAALTAKPNNSVTDVNNPCDSGIRCIEYRFHRNAKGLKPCVVSSLSSGIFNWSAM